MDEFESIYKEYHDDVYFFIYKLCYYDHAMAEDITQETFYHAYVGIGNFKGNCHVKTWLMQIAKNRYFIILRKRKCNEIPVHEIIEDTVGVIGLDCCEKIYEKTLLHHALDIIFEFKENMKVVFLDRIFLELTYRDIAGKLGISENSAKVLFHRGKLILRSRLRKEYGYEI